MTQYLEKYKKNIVIDMRKRGYSYSEIENAIHVPKSTIAFWLKDIKLTGPQAEKLKNKQIEIAKANSRKRKIKTAELIEEIKATSSKDVKEISKRELWLMGIVLYWKERLLLNNENDLRKGVNFTSSDPYLIKLFLKWLHEIGSIEKEELAFDIFMKEPVIVRSTTATERAMAKKNIIGESIEYWSEVTGYSGDNFAHIYFQKRAPKVKAKNIKSKNPDSEEKKALVKSQFGLLRVKVRASSMLARQISGWMKGVQRVLLK